MLQDPEGNLWSPKFGGKMELNSEGYYVSDATEQKQYAEGSEVDHGLHTIEDFESASQVKEKLDDWNTNGHSLAAAFARKYKRPEGSKLVWVKFIAYREDLIALGYNESFQDYLQIDAACGVYTKIKFIGLLD